MGTVVGMMGVAQAGEAIKILASALHLPSSEETNLTNPYLLIYSYDLQSGPNPLTFRALKMAGRRKKCFACGENSTLTLEGVKSGTPNYDQDIIFSILLGSFEIMIRRGRDSIFQRERDLGRRQTTELIVIRRARLDTL